ncbi:MAG: PIN domain-containing protein [Bradymonadaceae bacterium]
MAFVVVYDANVLYPAPLRDLLIRVAITGVVRARWTETILDECFRNIALQRPSLPSDRLQRTRDLMNRSIRDVLVEGYEPLIGSLSLPDPNDRHVLAAAIRAGAQVIVTINLKDFPSSALEPFGVEAKHPDDFLMEVIDLAPGSVATAVTDQARALKNPPTSLSELFDTLTQQGLNGSVQKLREFFGVV